MIFKNRPGQGIHLFAWNKTTEEGQIGDSANLHGYLSLDNGATAEMDATINDTIIEVGRGGYYCPLLQSETNANAIFIAGSSDTPDVVVDPMIGTTDGGAIPFANYAQAGGLGTVDANNRIPGIAGQQNTFDDIAGSAFDETFQLDKTTSLATLYAEIKKLFDTETWAELTAMPGATPTTVTLLMMLYHQARQKVDHNRTSGEQKIYNDAGAAIGQAATTDDGTTFTRDKFQDVS